MRLIDANCRVERGKRILVFQEEFGIGPTPRQGRTVRRRRRKNASQLAQKIRNHPERCNNVRAVRHFPVYFFPRNPKNL
jgi:hypothetical protein